MLACRFRVLWGLAIVVAGTPIVFGDTTADPADASKPLVLQGRTRTVADGGPQVREQELRWDPRETAVIICDMWDNHWCQGAAKRVAEMAPRMNQLISNLRDRGVLIIHCPSDTMEYYEGTPQRKLAQSAPKVELKPLAEGWCPLGGGKEPELPFPHAREDCDCDPVCQVHYPWTRQIDTLEIKDGDAITDSFEAYYLMKDRGIENVIMMGVHTNICVMRRQFAIRQMAAQGQNLVLVRDMTDALKGSKVPPLGMNHFDATDKVIEHIETYWCPTITSDQILGGKPFRFAGDKRKKLVIVTADQEYETARTLPDFADEFLASDFRCEHVTWAHKDSNDLPRIDELADADLAIFSVWRRTPPQAQMEVIRKYFADKKPLVALRITSHAFARRDGWPLPSGAAEWPHFDREILGGHYAGHMRGQGKAYAWVKPEAASHPIVQGVPKGEFATSSWLYKMLPLGDHATVLMMGRVGDIQPQQPVAWTNTASTGSQVFYTSLGHPDDFKLPAFRRLLLNGIYWAAGLTPPESVARQIQLGSAQ